MCEETLFEKSLAICFPQGVDGPDQDVAQSGSVSVLGTEGRRFESCHPDKGVE